MSVSGLVVLVLMSLGVLVFVLRPIFRSQPITLSQSLNKQRERATAYYERVLTNVRDLDDDFATDKIDPQEYQDERTVWVERGVKILQLLDELDADQSLAPHLEAEASEIDALIEARIHAMRQTESETNA